MLRKMGLKSYLHEKRLQQKLKVLRPKELKYQSQIKQSGVPKPTQEQLAWLDAEIGMFCHFGINTYCNLEWSKGDQSPSLFNPTNLDIRQWVQVAKSLGAKYMVATAKHHDGFCLWQTKTTDYGIASSPFREGKGDVIKEFLIACKEEGMHAGLYLSPWDRHEPCYSDKKAYDDFYCAQLTELLTWYDTELFEIWFDGAGSVGREYDWERIIGICQKYQPQALIFNMGAPTIRWVGNESGYARESNWNVIQLGNEYQGAQMNAVGTIGLSLKEVNGLGNKFIPAECDTPIHRRHWFYHTKDQKSLRSLKELIHVYDISVGRGSNLLLNIAPNRSGLIEKEDARRAQELGQLIQQRYSNPLISNSAIEPGNIAEIHFNVPTAVNCSISAENLNFGQLIREYSIQYQKGNEWITAVHATSIGHKKIDHFPEVKAQHWRLKTEFALDMPHIAYFQLLHI